MLDSRFSFMFTSDDDWSPDEDGEVSADLDALLARWIGSERPITVLDVSEIPASLLNVVVGTMLSIVYDALYWGMNLPVGGKEQPLLIVLDEAHRFLREGVGTAATRACSRIAKEGRKYGAGLMIVTQRPSDVDAGVLSQCGTMIALRVTNSADRQAVASTVPDDLGGLTDLLPSLRTGEGLVLGDALQVPSRIRILRAPDRRRRSAEREGFEPCQAVVAHRLDRRRKAADAGDRTDGGANNRAHRHRLELGEERA